MYAAHRKTCPCRPREVLVQQLAAQEEAHAAVQRRADDLAARVRQLEGANKVGARVCGGRGRSFTSTRCFLIARSPPPFSLCPPRRR